MKIGINGIGLWGRGLTEWQDFVNGLQQGFSEPPADPGKPGPTSIPARERRRAPLAVKLAVEVINQAATMAKQDESELCSVFASAMGDSHITDYICRTLAGEQKMLSPTKFHNSVHNSTSGYWSISTGSRLPSTFVSAFNDSFAAALLEAATIALSENRPTALAIYDVAFGQPLHDICPASEDFAAAFIVSPDPANSRWALELEFAGDNVANTGSHKFINERIQNNPAAHALTLCALLADDSLKQACWQLGPDATLSVTRD
jgi:hypothetical protein